MDGRPELFSVRRIRRLSQYRRRAVRATAAARKDASDCGGSSERESCRYLHRNATPARAESFTATDFSKFVVPLQLIRGKSRSWSNGAYAIFGLDRGGFVQFMSSPDGGQEYLFEIISHKYNGTVNEFLTANAVTLIERAGFVWPIGRNNFLRWFNAVSEDDITAMAELSLVVLSRVFGYRFPSPIKITTHVPD